MRLPLSCFTLPAALLLAVLALGPTTPARAASAPARRATPAATVRLPDSVLVRIDGREDITRRRFERAVRLLGGRPDSLTPKLRDEFLESVIEQRLLATRAAAANLAWYRADSTVLQSERDNILMRAALSQAFEQVEARRRALGQPDLDEEAMGVAARESLMTELGPTYETDNLRFAASYFAELPQPPVNASPQEILRISRLAPAIPAKDSARVLARSRFGTFRISDLLTDWNRQTTVYRPRVSDDAAVRMLIENSLFERLIRERTQDPALVEVPAVAAVLADRLEYHAVSNWLQREVIEKMPLDSLTLRRWYDAHLADHVAPARATLILVTLDDPLVADSLARRFRVAGEAESLAMRAQRAGANYTLAVNEAMDSALVARARALGVGGVGGPQKVDSGYRVFKVMSLEPARQRPFDEARPSVERQYYEIESDRLIREKLAELKRSARIVRNEPALRALVLPAARPAR